MKDRFWRLRKAEAPQDESPAWRRMPSHTQRDRMIAYEAALEVIG